MVRSSYLMVGKICANMIEIRFDCVLFTVCNNLCSKLDFVSLLLLKFCYAVVLSLTFINDVAYVAF